MSEGAWSGPAALELWHHALAPVAQLPVREVISGAHLLTDLTLGLGTLVHDYLTGWVPKALSNAMPVLNEIVSPM